MNQMESVVEEPTGAEHSNHTRDKPPHTGNSLVYLRIFANSVIFLSSSTDFSVSLAASAVSFRAAWRNSSASRRSSSEVGFAMGEQPATSPSPESIGSATGAKPVLRLRTLAAVTKSCTDFWGWGLSFLNFGYRPVCASFHPVFTRDAL
jgi:hypothetical protein